MKYYSASTGGLYRTDVHDVIPGDAVQITEQEYEELMGQVVVAGAAGRPMLGDPDHAAPLSTEQVLEHRRSAYRVESDHLKLEAEYDAVIAGTAPDYAAWLAKVTEIKVRYPVPE